MIKRRKRSKRQTLKGSAGIRIVADGENHRFVIDDGDDRSIEADLDDSVFAARSVSADPSNLGFCFFKGSPSQVCFRHDY